MVIESGKVNFTMQTNLLSDAKGFEKKNTSVITPKIKTGVVFISMIAAATTIWSMTAQIPIIVNASGIMIPSRGLFKASASSSGIVVYPFISKNGKVTFEPPLWSSEAYDYQWESTTIDSNNISRAINLAEKIEAEIAADEWVRFSSVDVDEAQAIIKVPYKSVIAIIDNAETRSNLILSLQEYKSDLKLSSARDLKLSKDLEGAKLLAQKNREIFESSRPISPQAISSTSLLQYEQQWLTELTTVRNIEQDIMLNKNKLVESRKNLIRSLQTYLTTSMVYAFEDAIINSFIEEQWASVSPGSELMTLSWTSEISPNTIPLFLDSTTYRQVSTGMEVILTPEGFNPAEVGGIKGTIQSIAPLPQDITILENTLGVSAAAQSATQSAGGSVYLAEVKLAVQDKYKINKNSLFLKNALESQTDNKGGFVWNNNSNPPLPPRTGLKLNAQVTTRYVTPAALVLSFLKELSGVEIPSKLRKNS